MATTKKTPATVVECPKCKAGLKDLYFREMIPSHRPIRRIEGNVIVLSDDVKDGNSDGHDRALQCFNCDEVFPIPEGMDLDTEYA